MYIMSKCVLHFSLLLGYDNVCEYQVDPFNQVGFPVLFNWTSQFPILGLFGGFFISFKYLTRILIANSGDTGQTPQCLPIIHKKSSIRGSVKSN